MGEIKSVKVDNWGVFFLQKLQNFFNKTDYCDLTLQFRDNSQLKVHRLVLSACTDYFNVLEQTCEMVDDALIMPYELQADVVVPIVNFMYTGTLEFELKMYGKLLRTAKDMNMTVLLKLLEAHRRTMEGVNRMQRPPSPKPLRRRAPTSASMPQQPAPNQQRRVLTTSPNSVSGVQRRITQTISTNASTQQTPYRQQIGSTSLIKTNSSSSTSTAMQGRAHYGNQIAYETHQTTIKTEPEEPTTTSPFEQLRKGYNNNKRPASTTLISPPTKKLNIEDVKEFAEQQRMRKQIAAEYGDDQGEYESGMMEDDIHNDDDDDELATTSATACTSSAMQPSTSRQTQLQHGATTITINQNEKPPTIVVKDSSNSKMNHAKIIKEVLRQYPHLVKSNKNIKLKIMPSSGDQPQKIIVKKEQLENISNEPQAQLPSQSQSVLRTQTSSQTLLKPLEKPQANIQQTPSALPVVSKVSPAQQKPPVTSAAPASIGGSTATPAAAPAQKRRIDSKTMHALIALGAENTTGPWLCLRCGVNGRPISIPSYRGFRRHLINTHKEYIDPALCEHCGWRSSNKRELHFHMEVEHKMKTTSYAFPQCLLCSNPFLDTNALNQHMVEAHPDENKQQCIYCNKIFARELQLYNHMKTYHKKQALEDGIIDYSDEEFSESQDATEIATPEVQDAATKEKKESKIKIISDISLPSTGAILKLEGNNVATEVTTQMDISAGQQDFMETNEGTIITSEPKFVNVDGNEMVLTEEQRKEIMAQLNQEHGAGGVVMVLNEPAEYTAETTSIAANRGEIENVEKQQLDQEIEHEAEHESEAEAMEEEFPNVAAAGSTADEDFDDSQIYNELHPAQSGQGDAEGTADINTTDVSDHKKNTSGGGALDESKESMENLEWAENLISAHEMADQEIEADKKDKENKNDDVINQKLKELTGDWSEDENEEEQHEATVSPSAEVEEPEESSNTIKNAVEGRDETSADKKETVREEAKIAEELTQESIEQEKIEGETDSLEVVGENVMPRDDDPGYTSTKVDVSKVEEDDDLDTLMKNLHKDDADITDVKSEETEDEVQKMETADVEVAVKNEKDITPSKESTTKGDGNISKPEIKKDEKSGAADNIVSLQRDVLLEELIADAESVSKDEFITKAQPAVTEITKSSSVEVEEPSTAFATKVEEPTEAVEEMKVDDTKATEVIATATAADGDGDAAAEAVKDAAIISKTKASDVDIVKTSERVNSLISEWAEDEEEDEHDTATPAAITEGDEEQL
ncbi:centrosome-associated zinc finger protein CP190 isoform X2 [Anastrepha obliqua]|nr:centrosome-associated zinc finger protein CP190 isoform X2 [Anastrepha obliqua]XP_054730904.1 centrosome-associated zinc finger protein CP190 isoform X2 [Anastrepha obliqua]